MKEHFTAFRDFQAKKDHTLQHNTYMYGDERGTVSEGPLCGPWEMNKHEGSSEHGMIHAARPYMRTLMGPDRSAVWLMKDLPKAGTTPAGFELFLGDGEFLRLSVGLMYDPTGKLAQVSAIREDSRGFDQEGAWTSSDESLQVLDAVPKDFIDALSHTTTSSLQVSVPGPVSTTQVGSEIDPKTFKFNNVEAGVDKIFQLPDNIIVVCPTKLPSSSDDGAFWVAAGWKKDDSLISSIEAQYANFHMEKMVHTKFTT